MNCEAGGTGAATQAAATLNGTALNFYAQCAQPFEHRVHARFRTGREGFVEAFAPESGVFRNLGDTARFGDVADVGDCGEQDVGVAVFKRCVEMLSDHFLAVEVVTRRAVRF